MLNRIGKYTLAEGISTLVTPSFRVCREIPCLCGTRSRWSSDGSLTGDIEVQLIQTYVSAQQGNDADATENFSNRSDPSLCYSIVVFLNAGNHPSDERGEMLKRDHAEQIDGRMRIGVAAGQRVSHIDLLKSGIPATGSTGLAARTAADC